MWRGVDAIELGGFDETAEAAVAFVEQVPYDVVRNAGREHDLAAHRPERVHDPELWTTGGLVSGAGLTEELPEPEPESELELGLELPTAAWSALDSLGIAAWVAAVE
jgi:hypothetical protein